MKHPERLLRLKEVAKVLNVSDSSVKRMRREGKLRVVRLRPNAVRITQRELRRLCAKEE